MALSGREWAIATASIIIGAAFGAIISEATPRTTNDDQAATIADLQRQLNFEKSEHEYDEKSWDAADAAFLDQHTFFHANAKLVIDAITSKFATSKPEGTETAASLKTNLGADVYIYTNGREVTSAKISFPESKRDHGIDIVQIVASKLTLGSQSVADVVRSASYRPASDYGVVLVRTHNAIVGTNNKQSGLVTVDFTPTKNK